MRLGLAIDYADDFAAAVQLARGADRLGLDLVSVAEAYSFDAVSRLGYLAAVTERVGLAATVLGAYTRSPATLAMTAAGLDDVSGGRFELGLGASGPQVVEGFHGVPFAAPLTRLREIVEVCRMVWRREPARLEGRTVRLPLPPEAGGTGLGKPLALVNHPVRPRIPIAIAALTPRSVAQTAEIADGWLPAFFHPEHASAMWADALATGAARRDPGLGPLDVHVQVPLRIGSGAAERAALAAHRARLALYVGGMGARGRNFYADVVAGFGFTDAAAEVQERFLAGDRAGAAAALPEDLVRGTSLIGDRAQVRDRWAAFADAGVTTVSVSPGGTADALDQLATLRELTA
ncbi:LLM class F420-dependent oxidoreductase [Isoptericola sp. b441]|uniref:LLM class F420-dependent oxidoreductase n=1 Tax=Actinotalea lenta TaxID=3064654 RepID=A0ABT9DCJ5_9CELL|nr:MULTISPECIES: LLM class F420-dependent oxidoreductase [unclassified Isoptericola]MDO8106918.1 LLM class F420-dependent oxidoreductase [Isoptericola sp. b441]MDO8121371.1 LLM class F420-dependent oxidoreductase [Isoptericola sp. b490]